MILLPSIKNYSDAKMNQQEILTNQPQQKKYVYSKLSYLLKTDDITEVIILVAFITPDGLYLILNELKELLDKQVRVVIITGFMNNFNSPRVFEFMRRIDNLEVRIADISGYHPKLYIVKHSDGSSSYIIGSSNLTNNALRRNFETNIYLEYSQDALIPQQINEIYQQVYSQSQALSAELLEEYRKKYELTRVKFEKTSPPLAETLVANSMQRKALAALGELRAQKQNKALIISATGSGKTYLSAFAITEFGARRVLFVVHRENILNAAIHSYTKVFPQLKAGKLTGELKQFESDFIFASLQTLQKDEYLYQFEADYFDYIVIDEVHRAGSAGYQKILKHFRPKFLLGMTATPERSDDFDIYQLFDHNIAYEIRLNEALEENLVCPFHYFGISELIINDNYLDDYSYFNQVNYSERVEHIIANLKLYGHGGSDKVRGLIFVSRVEEAHELSRYFNLAGYKTLSLSGADDDRARESAIQLLANQAYDANGKPQKYLDYIFSVDIFNEGIDIPCVNQIVLLRPTQSAIVFIQQLGRGLRKSPDKDYCVILDFIGNYTSSFLIAVALSGNNSYNKEDLRSFVSEANSLIPSNISVSFDRVTRERIYQSINNIQINRKFINQNYQELKKKLNRTPELIDFRLYNSIDPKIIFRYQNQSNKIMYNNYYELLKYHDDIAVTFSNNSVAYLNYITQELLFAARPDELYVLLSLVSGCNDENLIYANLANEYGVELSCQKQIAIRNILTLTTSNALQKKYLLSLLEADDNQFRLSNDFSQNLENASFKALVLQTIKLGLSYFEGYKSISKENDFVLYNKYSRKELVRLLNVNLSMETSIYGYRIIANSVPIFITYKKISANQMNAKYDNIFLNSQDLVWYSRPYSATISPELMKIINYRDNNLKIMIFLKKSDNEGGEHYYLGSADIHSYQEKSLANKSVMQFILRLTTPLLDSYFDYFVN
jgi:superfamily II DNA or RNA helicase